MTTYTAATIPSYKIKAGFKGPNTVSFFGAPPRPIEAYEVVQSPAIEVNDNGRVTYSNYFYGQRLTTLSEAEAIAAKLNMTMTMRRFTRYTFGPMMTALTLRAIQTGTMSIARMKRRNRS